jgi:uncharacterized protein (TIGR02452 family)
MNGFEHDRIIVWNQTKEKYKKLEQFHSEKFCGLDFIIPLKQYLNTKITFMKSDMIAEAVRLKLLGKKPLVLNMADWYHAGGCVDIGSAAQEEECFRRSNYFKTLIQDFYPLGKLDTILSKNVEYYRQGANVGYIYMENPVKLDMIAAPAIQSPQITKDNKMFLYKDDIMLMEDKIRMLVQIGVKNGNNILVLSAWGCGAFACPPYHIAKIFKRVLKEYNGVFEEIIFAILGPNYELFKSSWEEVSI